MGKKNSGGAILSSNGASDQGRDRHVRYVRLHKAPRFKSLAVLLYSVSSVIFEVSESRDKARGTPVRPDFVSRPPHLNLVILCKHWRLIIKQFRRLYSNHYSQFQLLFPNLIYATVNSLYIELGYNEITAISK